MLAVLSFPASPGLWRWVGELPEKGTGSSGYTVGLVIGSGLNPEPLTPSLIPFFFLLACWMWVELCPFTGGLRFGLSFANGLQEAEYEVQPGLLWQAEGWLLCCVGSQVGWATAANHQGALRCAVEG